MQQSTGAAGVPGLSIAYAADSAAQMIAQQVQQATQQAVVTTSAAAQIQEAHRSVM